MDAPMNAPLRKGWTQEQFFSWAERQEARYEFDGVAPVAMTGGSLNHDRITGNLHVALRTRLRGGPCEAFGPNAGMETLNHAVRYPDALVTCTKGDGRSRLVPGVVLVFEVLSPTSGREDRIVKVREYAAVSSIRRYIIVESSGIGLMVLDRQSPDEVWKTTVLTADEILRLPDIGTEFPVAEIYDGITVSDEHSIAE
jgi:Uma2 family endonuclease